MIARRERFAVLGVHEHVFGLEVAVNKSFLVEILQSRKNFRAIKASFRFYEIRVRALIENIGKEFQNSVLFKSAFRK